MVEITFSLNTPELDSFSSMYQRLGVYQLRTPRPESRTITSYLCNSYRKHPERNGAHDEFQSGKCVIARRVVEGCELCG